MREIIREYVILLPILLQLLGIVFFALNDKQISKKQKLLLFEIVLCDIILVVQNVAEYVLTEKVVDQDLRVFFGVIGYCLRPLIILLFCCFVSKSRKHIAAYILVIFNAAIHIADIFTARILTFAIDDNNKFFRGKFGYTSFIISAILLAYLVFCTIREHRLKRKTWWAALFIVGILVAATVLEISPWYFEYPISYITMAIVSCSLLYYIWLYIEYEEKHKNALMAEQRIKIMMSQIQPHFLYNTLSTIQALCLTNPQEASEITGKFGKYLRQNLESLEQPELIPFDKELQHTKVYADIEQVRFPNISVNYDIEYDNFKLPALSVQPLVENAIRHGVRNREEGIITVFADKAEDGVVVKVTDNGVGFDVETIRDSKDHIGLTNVKERIEKMCGGTLEVKSVINGGTIVCIFIPEKAGETI
jgi:hypothetical protein